MVYNGTSCGLNDVLWAPCFAPPTVKQMLRALLPGYMQCDLDVGEQFPNFYLHKELRKYSLQILTTPIRRLNGDRVCGNGGNATRWASKTHPIGACSGRSDSSLRFMVNEGIRKTLSIGNG